MKYLEINANELSPIQPNILKGKFLDYVMQEQNSEIPVIEHTGKYLIADGHHRSCAAFLSGRKVKIKVLDNDEEIKSCNEGSLADIDSKDVFLELYKTTYQPSLERENIHSIEDIVNKTLNKEIILLSK